MRTLAPSPPAVLEPLTGAPRYGAYRGELPAVDLAGLASGRLSRFLREKRWMYVAISADPWLFGIAVVDLGYLCNAFCFVYDRAEHRMIADESFLGPPMIGDVNDEAGAGHRARFRLGSASLSVERASLASGYEVRLSTRALALEARLETEGAPPGIAVVARVPSGVVNTTGKRALLAVRGDARVAGVRRSLDGGFGGYDYTHGLLARRTAWRWAFAQGRARSGERVAWNLVEGFVGEPECAVWIDDDVVPVGEGRFDFDASAPLAPWKVRTTDGAVDVTFSPGGVHAERKNLGLVASRFLQPMGVYRGTLRLPGGRVLELDDVLGVTEDQDVLW